MACKLKQWELGDKEELITICNSVEREFLSDRLPYPYTESDAELWLDMVQEHDGTDAIYRAIIVNDKIAGSISVEQKTDMLRKSAEIGYFLLTEYWSKGIMTEAVNQICTLAFAELDIVRITVYIFDENIASKKVLEKNGFVKEGLMKDAAFKNENLLDVCIYAKLQRI